MYSSKRQYLKLCQSVLYYVCQEVAGVFQRFPIRYSVIGTTKCRDYYSHSTVRFRHGLQNIISEYKSNKTGEKIHPSLPYADLFGHIHSHSDVGLLFLIKVVDDAEVIIVQTNLVQYLYDFFMFQIIECFLIVIETY